jgi:hypothetical protein
MVTGRDGSLFGPRTTVRPGDDVELELADGHELRARPR